MEHSVILTTKFVKKNDVTCVHVQKPIIIKLNLTLHQHETIFCRKERKLTILIY